MSIDTKNFFLYNFLYLFCFFCRTSDGENILEIYGFSSSLTNRDLMDVFAAYARTYFHIKWVDDTHALGVFASPSVGEFHMFLELLITIIFARPCGSLTCGDSFFLLIILFYIK